MKRFAFWFVLGLLAIAAVRANHRHNRDRDRPATVVAFEAGASDPKNADSGHALYRVEGQGRRTYTVAQLKKKFRGSKIVVVREGGNQDGVNDGDDEQEADRPSPRRKVMVADVPVPVIEGTRTTEAFASIKADQPPAAPPVPFASAPAQPEVTVLVDAPRGPLPPTPPLSSLITDGNGPARQGRGDWVVTFDDGTGEMQVVKAKAVESIKGRISATEKRSRDDARAQLVDWLHKQLNEEVPKAWPIPDRLVDRMIAKTEVVTSKRSVGDRETATFYETTYRLQQDPRRLRDIVDAHRHEGVVKRLTMLGGGLAFVLLCLGAVSGYIRADEATKGYYTKPLRIASAMSVGAGGVLLYQMLIGKI